MLSCTNQGEKPPQNASGIRRRCAHLIRTNTSKSILRRRIHMFLKKRWEGAMRLSRSWVVDHGSTLGNRADTLQETDAFFSHALWEKRDIDPDVILLAEGTSVIRYPQHLRGSVHTCGDLEHFYQTQIRIKRHHLIDSIRVLPAQSALGCVCCPVGGHLGYTICRRNGSPF